MRICTRPVNDTYLSLRKVEMLERKRNSNGVLQLLNELNLRNLRFKKAPFHKIKTKSS